MSEQGRIYVDLMKVDAERRIKLTTVGTREDLAKYGIELQEGLLLHLYTDWEDESGRQDNLIVDGVAHYDKASETWAATVDWDAIRHQSDLPGG
jgi:hypothetical protein